MNDKSSYYNASCFRRNDEVAIKYKNNVKPIFQLILFEESAAIAIYDSVKERKG